MAFALICRISLLFSIPNLSDDYFRFIWDGRLLANGINPFSYLPSEIIDSHLMTIAGVDQELFANLNSPNYYTIYPPVCQFIFWISAMLFPSSITGSVLVMKCFILLAEIGSIYLLIKIISKLNLDKRNVLLYALNPLVIMELTGNIHFEAVMIFFLLVFIYFLVEDKLMPAALFLGLAVATKLLPLIFLPLLIRRIGFKKNVFFGLIVFAVVLILFMPFIDDKLINNLSSSITLYFQRFEFNTSTYYILRWIGCQIMGYNAIATIGIILGSVTFISIMLLTFFEKGPDNKNIPQTMLFALTIYFLLANIVHPWYITSLVALSVLSSWRYSIIWSGVVFLSYYAYKSIPYQESIWLITLEYTLVGGYYLYERYSRTKKIALLF